MGLPKYVNLPAPLKVLASVHKRLRRQAKAQDRSLTKHLIARIVEVSKDDIEAERITEGRVVLHEHRRQRN